MSELSSWIVALTVFLMVFLPLWRAGKSICNGIDRINARKADKPLGRAIGYHNKPGRN